LWTILVLVRRTSVKELFSVIALCDELEFPIGMDASEYYERVLLGESFPAGRCPDCGGRAHGILNWFDRLGDDGQI
jgi:hypothetical protein